MSKQAVHVTGSAPDLEPVIEGQRPAVQLTPELEDLIVRQLSEALAVEYRTEQDARVGSAA